MIHHIPDEWLIDLETKLHLATLKSDRLGNRLNKIVAEIERMRQNNVEERKNEVSDNNKPKLWQKIRLKLAIKKKE